MASRHKTWDWIFIGLSLIPVCVVIALWTRSYFVYDSFFERMEFARWPNGTVQALTPYDLIRRPWRGDEPIYAIQQKILDSRGGGITFNYYYRKSDLSNQDVFIKEVYGSMEEVPPRKVMNRLYHNTYRLTNGLFFILDPFSNRISWDIQSQSTGDWNSDHQIENSFSLVIPYFHLALLSLGPPVLINSMIILRSRLLNKNKV
jgi:hypothetical protein